MSSKNEQDSSSNDSGGLQYESTDAHKYASGRHDAPHDTSLVGRVKHLYGDSLFQVALIGMCCFLWYVERGNKTIRLAHPFPV